VFGAALVANPGEMARRVFRAGRIEGVRTAVPFFARVLENAGYRAGKSHTQMVEQGAFDA